MGLSPTKLSARSILAGLFSARLSAPSGAVGWRRVLKLSVTRSTLAWQIGPLKFAGDGPRIPYLGETSFKGLGFYPESYQRFIEQILENIEKLAKR